MKKNMDMNFSNYDMESAKAVNRKRSQRWVSDETKLLNKYGVSGRYLDVYVLADSMDEACA